MEVSATYRQNVSRKLQEGVAGFGGLPRLEQRCVNFGIIELDRGGPGRRGGDNEQTYLTKPGV